MCSKHIEVSKKCFFSSLFIKVKMGVRLCYNGMSPNQWLKLLNVNILLVL